MKKTDPSNKQGGSPIARSRKALENTAAFGLILVAVGIAAPFADLTNPGYVAVFKWIYSAGALIFTGARIAGSSDAGESMRIRRLRRLEFWAGVAFCIGAFFWFYNEDRYSFLLSQGVGVLTYLRETIYFTLAGGVIQIVAIMALSYRLKKENGNNVKK